MRSFEELIEEAEAEPLGGFEFSWFENRATEQRPPWGYARLLVGRIEQAGAVLDVQTGGGEVIAGALAKAGRLPRLLTATESWEPSIAAARAALSPYEGAVVQVEDDDPFPFRDSSFDLVVSRHPTVAMWDEIARVLAPGGTYFSQQVGHGSNRELTDFMMGPQPLHFGRSPENAVRGAEQAGLTVMDLRLATLEVAFYDVGAVAYFLRKVPWTVPDFSIASYRDRLWAMHEKIRGEGRFVSRSQRFLIEATRRPG